MNIAFYAPLKAPGHPTPSGDRLLARLFLKALGGAGHDVHLASAFRSRDGGGDRQRQALLRDIGKRLADRLSAHYRAMPAAERPALWFTYHLYHKAPDWLGPRIADALGIPYVLAEASFAAKQEGGPWAIGHAAARDAIAAADAVFNLNPGDADGVRPLLDDARRLVPLKPFVDASRFPHRQAPNGTRAKLAAQFALPSAEPWLIAVAMMRADNKRESYRLLAEALAKLEGDPWRLIIVGDGPARADVGAFFDAFAPARVVFTGVLGGDALRSLVASCDLFVWPAIDEPIGMAMLEAQMAGLPVVTGAGPGIGGIVRDGRTGRLVPRGDAEAFAAAVAELLAAPARRAALGAGARRKALSDHDIASASAAIGSVVNALHAGAWP